MCFFFLLEKRGGLACLGNVTQADLAFFVFPLETSRAPSPASSSSRAALEYHDCASSDAQFKEAPQSPALSATSTADEDEGGSSPIIPSLPAPQLTERALNLLRTPPPTRGSESIAGLSVNAPSTQFYTASWGSPYETAYQPSSFGGIAPTTQNDRKSTGTDSEKSDSPIRHLDFHTPYLRPAPAFPRSRSSEPSGGLANVLAKRARRPAQGLTEDWIRAHTGGEFGEGANWLSDEEIESEHSSLSGSISTDSKHWPEKDSDPRTPTLKSFVRRKEQDRTSQFLLPGQHQRHTSVETLKQEDFAEQTPKKSRLFNMENMGNSASGIAEESPALPARQSLNSQKKLPPPPVDVPEKDTLPPESRAAALPTNIARAQSPAMLSQLSTSPAPPSARLKKKVPWKGNKTVTIHIPMDEERGQLGKAPKPMSEFDVVNMNREWLQLGYDTTGFNLGYAPDSNDGSANGRSRHIWPDPDDVRTEYSSRQFRVSIPDRRKWDEYVQELAEAKLRALGVSLPGEEPPPASISPALPSRKSSISITRHASMSMSRGNSTMQYPALPFSPPLPTGSATSSHMTQHPNPFSPVFTAGPGPSTNQSSNVGSVASPVSMQAQFQNKYNPRQSVSFGSSSGAGEHPFGSPFQFPHQASPGVWSPSQMLFGQQGMPRGGSPALQNPNAFFSPTSSPFSPDGYFGQDNLPLRHQVLDQAARKSPRLQDLKEVDDLDEVDLKSPSKTPEASVLNRQHNPSASLQKEIDDAEYHLEEQIQRQLDHEDYSPHQAETGQASANSNTNDMGNTHINNGSISSLRVGINSSKYASESDGPTLHHPQPHSRGHSLSQRPYTDTDDDSNGMQNFSQNKQNQGENPPFGHDRVSSFASNVSNPWSHSRTASLATANRPKHSGHSSKASLSGLNVEAPEFKFDPGSAFKPNQFAFNQNAFQPTVAAQSAFVFDAPARPNHAHQQSSFGSSKAFGSKINPDAPVFSPGNSTFNFSASGPSFRPSASTFVPTTGSSSGVGSPIEAAGSIFGKLNMADVVKQPKKSKAVPIVRPDSPKEAEDDDVEDAFGRITRGAGREKRARGEQGDGDSIPLFAAPSMPLSETTREQSPPKENVATVVKAADNKENATPSSDNEDTSDDRAPSQSHERTKSLLEDKPDYDGSGWAPWESFHERKEAEESNAAKALPIPKRMASFEIYEPGSSDDYATLPSMQPEAMKKGHKKNTSSLSATAKPFELRPNELSNQNNAPFAFGASTNKSEGSSISSPPLVKKPMRGLEASKYAVSSPSPSPEPEQEQEQEDEDDDREEGEISEHSDDLELPDPILDASDERFLDEEPDLPRPSSQVYGDDQEGSVDDDEASTHHELTFEEIDERMRAMNENEVVGDDEASTHRELSFEEIDERMRALNEIELKSSPVQRQQNHLDLPLLDVLDVPLSPMRFPHPHMRSDAPSPSPPRNRHLPSRDLSKQFGMQPPAFESSPLAKDSMAGRAYGSPIHRLNTANSLAQSDWNDMLSEGEEAKLQQRSQFFDTHVNGIVGGILSDRLAPIERVLENVMQSVELLTARGKTPSSRRNRRSFSGDLPQSDADDEDDEHTTRRSVSPRTDKKYEKIRNIVAEALAAYRPVSSSSEVPTLAVPDKSTDVLKVLEEMKEQFGQSMRLDLRGEDLRNIVQEAVDKRLPIVDDEQKPDPRVAELEAKVSELAEKLQTSEQSVETEIKNRRAAEDRMAEVQRLLRISSEEEVRLRESLEESEQKTKIAEDAKAKLTMKVAVMEASQENNQQIQSDALNRVNLLEAELLEARRIASGWQLDAERALEAAKRHSDDAEQANETNADLKVRIEMLRAQMEESTRIREGMRGKFNSLQEDMARAAREISEENSRRAKKEQELIARQEVLDARLQAEARTRERLEMEIERLEKGERDAMRAVSDNKRLESLLGDLRSENHEAQMLVMKHKREFEEARESGLSEVQRTRSYMQTEIDTANHEVNVVRDDMEIQVSRLRAELDQIRLEADTHRARNDMFLEEATEAKRTITEDLTRRHERIVEDMQTRHESKLSDTIEDARRAEQHLLERLSLSSAKTEHLQDRVSHLEEKLEIAQAAANAAAQAARTASIASPPVTATAPAPSKTTPTSSSGLPEKISPQALRESIMVLQEQLQDREQKIEKLEQSLSVVDLDAPNKISKRDDEITWLRELLGVRNADLQDIVNALSTENYDAEAVRDAAIRLRANLQMEEQERERALNGGSAVNLPNIAAGISSIREAASPRIAQGVGSIAAAWGNWRGTPNKGASSVSGSAKGTTSRDNNTPSRSSLLSGLLTPPASTRTPTNKSSSSLSQSSEAQAGGSQPTAFGNTGRRFTAQQLANRPTSKTRGGNNLTPRAREKMPGRNLNTVGMPPPATPPMLRKSSYDEDADARATDDGFSFSEDGDGDGDAGFYDEDVGEEDGDARVMTGEGMGI